jgi:hypothetical protein
LLPEEILRLTREILPLVVTLIIAARRHDHGWRIEGPPISIDITWLFAKSQDLFTSLLQTKSASPKARACV